MYLIGNVMIVYVQEYGQGYFIDSKNWYRYADLTCAAYFFSFHGAIFPSIFFSSSFFSLESFNLENLLKVNNCQMPPAGLPLAL